MQSESLEKRRPCQAGEGAEPSAFSFCGETERRAQSFKIEQIVTSSDLFLWEVGMSSPSPVQEATDRVVVGSQGKRKSQSESAAEKWTQAVEANQCKGVVPTFDIKPPMGLRFHFAVPCTFSKSLCRSGFSRS